MRNIYFILFLFTGVANAQTLDFLVPPVLQQPFTNSITIDNRGNLFDLNDQVKLVLNSSNFDFNKAQPDGRDLRFYTATGTLLNHWIESWDGIFQGIVWIKVNSIPAGTSGTINMRYGGTGLTTLSSFTNTMRRFQTSEPNAAYVVRFNDGSGTTAANIGTSGGTMSIVGGKTWNTNDIWGEANTSLTLDGSTGYIEKAGLLDSWGTKGSLHISFTLNSTASDQTIFSKRNRALVGSGDDGDYVQLYFKSSNSKLTLKFSAGSSQKLTMTGVTSLVAGKRYTVSLVWNTKLSDNFGGWMIVFMNGLRELDTYNVVSYPPSGSDSPFRIGAMSNITTGAAETFASFTINDFAYQTEQVYWGKLQALHEWRNYYQKDDKSKWNVSATPGFGPVSAGHYPSEPFLFSESGNIYVYYTFYDGSAYSIRRQQTTALVPNTTPTWTNDIKILGGGTGGESGYALRAMIRKFGSTYYMYYRDGLGAGAVVCVTSTDGFTFGSKTTVLPVPGTGFGQFGFFNCDVVLADDGYYYMCVDELDTGGSNIYLDGIFRCATPNGTFVPYGTNPKMTMVPGDGTGLVGAPSINLVNSVINIWLLASPVHPVGGSLPNDIYRAYSVDWNNYTPTQQPIIIRERATEYDQASDMNVLEIAGSSYIVYNGLDNAQRPGYTTFVGYINYAKFDGTLAQMTTDLNVSLLDNQHNTAIDLNPLSYYDNSPFFMDTDIKNTVRWLDRINGNTVTQTSAPAKPVYTASVLNGRPAYVYNASQFLTTTKLPVEGKAGLTMAVVGKDYCMSQDNGTNTGRISIIQTGGVVYILVDGVNGYATFSKSSSVFNYTIAVYDGTQTGNANRLKAWCNGVQQTLTFTGTTPALTGTNAANVFYLHKQVGAGAAGQTCEFEILDRAITGTELTDLMSFYSTRYGL